MYLQDLDVWRVPDDRERSADVYVKSNYVGMVKIALADASLEYVIWRKHIDRLVYINKPFAISSLRNGNFYRCVNMILSSWDLKR